MTDDPAGAIHRAANAKLPVRRVAGNRHMAESLTFRLRPDERAKIDDRARRYGMSRSAYARFRLIEDGAAVEPPRMPHPSGFHPDPHALESLTADEPLSRYWDVLGPWTDRLEGTGTQWFTQWPLAPGVMERIEAVWPLLTRKCSNLRGGSQ